MNKKLFELKKRLISVISDKTYYGLINFAEKIYNADCDIVILMARKASNLYAALLPLVKEEYLGSIEEKHKEKGNHVPKVISDRAIEMVLSDIKCHKEKTKYKRILVADDIIIHGTTMALIREKLKNAYAEAGVSETEYQINIMAYAENMDGIALNAGDIYNSDTIMKCSASSWKIISNKIIDVLLITGRPYISYIPNAEIEMGAPLGKNIKNFIKEGKAEEIIDRNMSRRNVKTYVVSLEHESGFMLSETYRIYEYSDLGKYVFVPMVTMNPINESMLELYLKTLFDYMTDEGKEGIAKVVKDMGGEYLYRVAVYTFSAIGGWNFFIKVLGQKAEECIYDVKEEIMNFSCPFLHKYADLGKNLTSDETFKRINEIYDSLKDEMSSLEKCAIGDDVRKLEGKVDDLITYTQNKGSIDSGVSDDIIAKILEINNRLDEAEFNACKKEGEIRRRMKGVPVVSTHRKLRQIIDSEKNAKNVKAIVHAIDTGKGAIVPFSIECGKQKFFISMIRAGEQNYRYYLDNYLPIMYGFYIIEKAHKDQIKKNKEILWEQYYKESKMPFFGEEDREYLISRVSMDKEFEDVIIDEALREDNQEIEKISKMINLQMIG